jgi:uncharacterized protein (TIGR02271 family)
MPISQKASYVTAFFRNSADAENAIERLINAGFRSNQIGSSFEDYDEPSRKGHGFWDKVGNFFSGDTGYEDRDTGTADGPRQEGRAIGRTLTIPETYRDRMAEGGAFVSVYDTDRLTEAEEILRRSNGEIEQDFNRFPAAETEVEREGEHRIQLLSEVLRVRKDRVQRGEVRLRKEVVTETQNVQVPVSREELVVERTPVEGRDATDEIGAEKEIRVPLSEERVTVEKKPVVKEEVRVGKRAVEDMENISDETRREELRVEKEGDVTELDEEDIKKRKPRKAA